jgi:hypothetical protein
VRQSGERDTEEEERRGEEPSTAHVRPDMARLGMGSDDDQQ